MEYGAELDEEQTNRGYNVRNLAKFLFFILDDGCRDAVDDDTAHVDIGAGEAD
jgi:hypothetical protein